ncbi:phosphotransferase [Embleya sp. NPDC059237]|uniref:phosphotransferase n=1 Tax=Embleya sp. NPDC059237 TaxID=3346784 RepID=UPI003673FCBF
MTDEAANVDGVSLLDGDRQVLIHAFDLGAIHRTAHLAEGLMNRNWLIDTDAGRFVLKQVLDVPFATARRNLAVLARLDADGIPACPAVPSAEEELVVGIGDRGYSLFPWVEGTHRHGTTLDAERATELGALLGRIHRALNEANVAAALPAKPDSVGAAAESPWDAVAEADRLLGVVAALPEPSAFDRRVVELLEQRKVLIEKYAVSRPGDDLPLGPFGWVHGDFQHLNVLWGDEGVVAVLDWDRIRVKPFGEEVARSATLLFGRESGELDLERVAAFVAGYRSVVPIGVAELADAVERLWWKRMCDFWQLVFHYDRANHTTDHLFFSATDFLHWWTAHRDEVQAAFAGV